MRIPGSEARVLRRQRWTRAKRNTKVFYLLQHMMRCSECGFLMGGSANTKKEVKRNGKLYKYELDPPRRYYRCYGYQQMRLQCRAKPMIRAERLESLVWGQVKNALENPDLIVAGIEALNAQEDGGGLVEEIAEAERDLQKVQMEEDRAIRLYVSGKITEGPAGPSAQVHHGAAGDAPCQTGRVPLSADGAGREAHPDGEHRHLGREDGRQPRRPVRRRTPRTCWSFFSTG